MTARSAHPASAIDLAAASARFHASILGGDYWDALAVAMRPDLSQCGDEHLDYTFDACVEHELAAEGTDPRSPEGVEALRRWTDLRASTCSEILAKLPVIDGHVRAHRLIACTPEKLRPALGLFWTHDFENWPDPYAPWTPDGRDAPTLIVEAMIPVIAIDWQVSCLALMDWFSGDCESELRAIPGHPVRIVGCSWLADNTAVTLPDQAYTT